MTAAAGLHVEGLTARRGAFALAPVTCEVARGETLFVTGANGAGKSTLLAALAGLIRSERGSIAWDGALLAGPAVHRAPWRRDVALLLQDLGLWPHLTIAKQCSLVADSRAGAAERIAQLAEALGVAALLDRKPARLSGGEAQRSALLRTLAPARGLLLLDEPYSEQHADGIARIDRVLAAESAAGRAIIIAGQRAPAAAARTLEIGRA
ncbi:MAG: ATP-binding cassette domain-containing protein [Planctomycetes bacterium]|nr:ATP-binding cassette domain-containing protein [Planctomycetota bacterium]